MDDEEDVGPPTVAAIVVVGCLAELVAVVAWIVWRLLR